MVAALVGAAVSDAAATATARLSTTRAGARPVAVTLTFETVYQCGVPKRAVVTLPLGERMPTRLATGSVRVDGKATAVSVDGRSVTVGRSPAGVTCHSLR